MIKAPIPQNEQARLDALYKLGLLNTPPEERFDRIADKAIQRFDAMLSSITLVDKDREWFKSCRGTSIYAEGPRDISFCGHALTQEGIFIIEDTKKDDRFFDNPYVVGPPYVRFYAGIALHDKNTNLPIGVFCIKDNKPRIFNEQDISDFLNFAKLAENELNSKAKASIQPGING